MAKRRDEDEQQSNLPMPVGGAVAEYIGGGNAVLKYQTETMMRVALERPRDEKKCLARALMEIELVPEEAENNWYSIPYKDHEFGCTKPRGKGGKFTCKCPEEWIEGPSIAAALTLGRCWQNALARVRVDDETDKWVRLVGVFNDYENNWSVEYPITVSKVYRSRGNVAVTMTDKVLEKAIGAGASKAMRNVILRGLPKSYISQYIKRAKEVYARHEKAKGKTLAERIELMVASFAPFGVTGEMLAAHLEHDVEDATEDDLFKLRGIFNSLRQKEQTVADIFGGGEEGPEDEPPTITPNKAVATAIDESPTTDARAKEQPARQQKKAAPAFDANW